MVLRRSPPARYRSRRALGVLVLAGAALAANPDSARAAPIPFSFAGVFGDGGTVSGTFLFDPLQPASPLPPPIFGTIGSFQITSTQGSVFGGFTYVGTGAGAQITAPSCGAIQFNFAIVNQSQLVISVPGSSFSAFSGGPIVSSCPGGGTSIISFEQLFPPTGVYRAVTGGQVSMAQVPEPTSSVLALMGLALLGVVRVTSVNLRKRDYRARKSSPAWRVRAERSRGQIVTSTKE